MAEPNAVEIWKAAKHGFDVWPDILRWAQEGTPHDRIDEPDLQRMKWYGIFWRKHDRDRYMIRIRIPGCEMTADQARAVAFVAYNQACTHLACPVTYRRGARELYCPCHEGYFAVDDGRPLSGPPKRPLPRVLLSVREDGVWATGVVES